MFAVQQEVPKDVAYLARRGEIAVVLAAASTTLCDTVAIHSVFLKLWVM